VPTTITFLPAKVDGSLNCVEWRVVPVNFDMPGMVGIRGSPFRPVAWTIWWGWNVPASREYVLLIQNMSSEGITSGDLPILVLF